MIISLNSNAQVANLLPSVTSTTNAVNVTERYRHIQSDDIIEELGAHGYVLANQHGKRNTEHGKHGLFFVNRTIGFLDNTGSENFASVVLFNSHDGKSALKLVSGFLRTVCSNGMVSGNSLDHVSIRHTQKGYASLPLLVAELPNKIENFRETINMLQNTQLDTRAVAELLTLVHDSIKFVRPIEKPADMYHLRRYEDNVSDAYTVANIIQENLIKGGMVSANSNRRLRGITAVNRQSELTQLVMNTTVDYVSKRAA